MYPLKAQKINEAILFIAPLAPNMYNILKILYFADKEHLAKYGKFITNDDHFALKEGPVPSLAYDLIKLARGDEKSFITVNIEKTFTVENNNIMPLRKANLDFFSATEIECLQQAIKVYGKLNYSELKKIGHADPAYINTPLNKQITLEEIVKSLPDSEELLEYLEQK
ncbi:MAG TPA: Panacea domain-containing protein [bacterium]|nr:Panacea domain-containing protein [bacterium]HPN44123.1 Panacea domain-containing protein [bacterium]